MESHTKIVELFGLPGCGKTTLTDFLIDQDQTIGITSYVRLQFLWQQYCSLPYAKKLSSLPFVAWFYCVLFIISVPRIPLKKWRLYRSFFYLSILYSAKRKLRTSEYILVDHGLVQSAQSVIYGHADTLSQRSWTLLLKILRSLKVDALVYCKIPIDMSLKRIRMRNRKNDGRLDMIEDDSQLRSILSMQELFFDNAFDTSQTLEDTHVLNIDTSGTIDNIAENLSLKIRSL